MLKLNKKFNALMIVASKHVSFPRSTKKVRPKKNQGHPKSQKSTFLTTPNFTKAEKKLRRRTNREGDEGEADRPLPCASPRRGGRRTPLPNFRSICPS
jgi:hypothetical protein